MATLASAHMTGICITRLADNSLQVAVEHWHGSTPPAGTFRVEQLGTALVVTGSWTGQLGCGCPGGCSTNYFSCGDGCVGSGTWTASFADPGFVIGGPQLRLSALNGGAVTESCGSCGANAGDVDVPPLVATCFSGVCDNGIIEPGETCEGGIIPPPGCADPPGYPVQTCDCCVLGQCCTPGEAYCLNPTVGLTAGSGTVSIAELSDTSTSFPSANCDLGYPAASHSSFSCSDLGTQSVTVYYGPDNSEHCVSIVTVVEADAAINCPSGSPYTLTSSSGGTATINHPLPTCTSFCSGNPSPGQVGGPAYGSEVGFGTYSTVWQCQGIATQCRVDFSVIGTLITSPAWGATIYMYIDLDLSMDFFMPNDVEFSIEIMDEGSNVVENTLGPYAIASQVAVSPGVSRALPGYKDLRVVGEQSGAASTSGHLWLCPSPFSCPTAPGP